MNVLQILPALNIGGVERGVIDLSKYLTSHKHKSVVISSGGALLKDLTQQGNALHYQLPVHKKNPIIMALMVWQVRKIIRKECIDIVHARSRVPAWIAFFACKRTRAVFITTCHGYYSSRLFSYIMGWSKFCIVISEAIAKRMMQDFCVPLEKIRLIFRGVDLDNFQFRGIQKVPKDNFIITVVARITPLKGHAYFLRAIAKVRLVLPNIKVWIVGDAPLDKQYYKEELVTLSKRLGLANIVEFLGKQDDIPQILRQSDILVMPTLTPEAFGRAILEAQAVGVAVVATNVGGIIEIVEDKKTGLLASPLDINAMAGAIIKLLSDSNLMQSIILNARKSVEENFTLTKMCEKTLEVYKEALSVKRILVIKWSAIGDVVLSIPALRALREKFPSAKIYCLTSSSVSSLLVRCPYINGLLIFDSKGKDKTPLAMLRLIRQVSRFGFDIVIDLQNNNRSHIISFFSNANQRYGYRNKKLGWLLNKGIKLPAKDIPPVLHQFNILQPFGISSKDLHLEFWTSNEDKDSVDKFLKNQWLRTDSRLVGINISASPKWVTKVWPLKNFADAIDELNNEGIHVVVTGIMQDKYQVAKLKRLTNAKFIDAVGKTTLSELAYLIKRCSVYLTADSAPMHIAAAVNTPIVVLFGPTDPARHIPPTDKIIIIRRGLDCSPCYKRECQTISCMHDIYPNQVIEAIHQLLNYTQMGTR